MKRPAGTLIFAWKAVLILLILCCLYPATSFATSPQDMKLEYDVGTQMLAVTITHPSSFPNYHYIKYVEIKKDGADVMKNTYKNQPDTDTFAYTYKVPAAEGETLEVTATCSVNGYKTVNLTVGKK
jgi:desulfoferrodoxin (superoxide reductase-like protein)